MKIKSLAIAVVASVFVASFVLPMVTVGESMPSDTSEQEELKKVIQDLVVQLQALTEEMIRQREAELKNHPDYCGPGGLILTKDVKRGDWGYNVSTLAYILHNIEHLGSPVADASTYEFTESLEKDVRLYQERYKEEILTPLGLTQATGIVGPATRSHINKRCLRLPSPSFVTSPN